MSGNCPAIRGQRWGVVLPVWSLLANKTLLQTQQERLSGSAMMVQRGEFETRYSRTQGPYRGLRFGLRLRFRPYAW